MVHLCLSFAWLPPYLYSFRIISRSYILFLAGVKCHVMVVKSLTVLYFSVVLRFKHVPLW